MIADLKADSERWEQERRATASRGQPSNGIPFRDSDGIVRKSNTNIVEYRASTTHQSRQYYGPTEAAPGAAPGYPTSAATGTQQVYDSSAQSAYPQQSYAQPSTGYVQQPQGYAVQDNNYYVGGHMAVDDRGSSARVPVTQSSVPRSNVQYPSSNSAYPAQDSRTLYYSSAQQPGVAVSSTAAQYPQQPADPYYGRGAYNHQPVLHENFLTFKLSLQQDHMTAKILTIAEHTRTALPTARSPCLLPLQLLLLVLLPVLPGVTGKTATATGPITAIAVVNFPLGVVLSHPYSGFIQRPALFWRFFFYCDLPGSTAISGSFASGRCPAWNQTIV